MLTLLALVSTAIAGDDPLADEIRAVQADVGGPVLLCVAGEKAEQATRKTLRDIGQEDLPITRVPTVGDTDAEMARALEAGGLPCALRIAPTEGGFDLSRYGACDAVATDGGEVAADVDSPPLATRDAKARAAAEATEPEPVVVTETEWATREARYQRERLMLVDLPPDPLLPPGVSWEVVDGRGSSLSARSLVTIAQDDDLSYELDKELDRSKVASKAMFWTGVGLAVLSPLPLIGVEDGAVSTNQDRAWSSVFLLASAGLTMSLSRAPRKAARARQQHPALYMDGDMAEDVVVVHNHRLYGSLELDQRPPPPAEEEPATQEGSDTEAPDGDAAEPTPAAGAAAPVDGAPAEDTPAEDAPAEGTPAAEVPTEDAAPADAPDEDASLPEADTPPPAEPVPADAAPAPDAPAPDATEPAATEPAADAPTDGGEGAASDR